jgi:hypothetical protein
VKQGAEGGGEATTDLRLGSYNAVTSRKLVSLFTACKVSTGVPLALIRVVRASSARRPHAVPLASVSE